MPATNTAGSALASGGRGRSFPGALGNNASCIAAAALSACGITQQQLCTLPTATGLLKELTAQQPADALPLQRGSGGGAEAGNTLTAGSEAVAADGGAGGGLLFLDPAFLEVEDPAERSLMLRGLEVSLGWIALG